MINVWNGLRAAEWAVACVCLGAFLTGCPAATDKATEADFMALRTSGTAPLAVQFIDVSFVAAGETVQRWTWAFGDDGISTDQDPIHVYTTPGTYDVTLTIETDTDKATSQVTKTAFVTVNTPGTNPGDAVQAGEMVSVAAGSFTMGATSTENGKADEYPSHRVTLSAYQIGKFEVTNKEFADVLNAALASHHLYNASGGIYDGGDVYTEDKLLIETSNVACQITFEDNQFAPRVRDGYAMDTHPVVMVTWYGAVAFCNWLSESQDIDPYYDLATWADATTGPYGYRLPTEAEWERAAAWQASGTHWIYGFSSNLIDFSRCTYAIAETGQTVDFTNPLGLTSLPYTTPVGYYNGANGTANYCSPVRCYDMSGNVLEWCFDHYGAYTEDDQTNPEGPESGGKRIVRGGSWYQGATACRSAYRGGMMPARDLSFIGFRTARTPSE